MDGGLVAYLPGEGVRHHGQRERAVNEYKQAERTKDNTQGALEEAAKYLKTPYERQKKAERCSTRTPACPTSLPQTRLSVRRVAREYCLAHPPSSARRTRRNDTCRVTGPTTVKAVRPVYSNITVHRATWKRQHPIAGFRLDSRFPQQLILFLLLRGRLFRNKPVCPAPPVANRFTRIAARKERARQKTFTPRVTQQRRKWRGDPQAQAVKAVDQTSHALAEAGDPIEWPSSSVSRWVNRQTVRTPSMNSYDFIVEISAAPCPR